MKIGLLVIGSEVLSGKISDTNTRSLADFLKLHHLELLESMTVRDDEKSIHRGLTNLFKDCDLVITSGGLGPTLDDITKQTIASFLNRTISYSELAHEVALKNYQKFERPFPGKEHGYCYLPEGFIALNNSTGFAPNLYAVHHDKMILCGPGVPREFKSMLSEHFINLIGPKLEQTFLETILVRTRRIPEEKIFGEVDTSLWEKLSQYGEVSSLPIVLGVDIGVKVTGDTASDLKNKKEKVLAIFDQSPVKNSIWQIGQKNVEELIVELANQKNIKFGFAESCTGGLCSSRITNVSGSSQSFFGSIVCYDEKVKQDLLGVKEESLKNFTAVSSEVAHEMSYGLHQKMNLDIAISITGYAGPTGGTNENPVGTVFIGKTVKGKTETFRYKFVGDREQLKIRFSEAALHLLLESLENLSG